MNTFERLIVIAVVIMPFTLLRVEFMGLGELIIFFLFIKEITGEKHNINKLIFSKFWFKFLIFSLIGLTFSWLFINEKTGGFEGFLFDFSAYILIIMGCYTIENHAQHSQIDFQKVLKKIFVYSGIVFTFLFALSFITDSIFGFPLKIYTQFAPFAKNIHQIALAIIPLPFIGLFIVKNEKNKAYKLFYLFLSTMLVLMAIKTGSFKVIVGFVLGAIVFFFFRFTNNLREELKILFLVLFFTLISLLLVFQVDRFIEILVKIFISEDISSGRFLLYSQALKTGTLSPIFGLGPGPHLWDGNQFWDSHQTFLTIYLQAGIVGVIFLITLLIKVVKKLVVKPALLASFVPILIYILGGDILRKLPLWIVIICIYYACKNSISQTNLTNLE